MDFLRQFFPEFFDEAPVQEPLAPAPVDATQAEPDATTSPSPVGSPEKEKVLMKNSDKLEAILNDLYAKNAALSARVDELEQSRPFNPSNVSGFVAPVASDTTTGTSDPSAPAADSSLTSGTVAS